MLYFVATKEGQGKRKNDFSWTDEGEVVHFPFECDGETVDGSCGCRRSMSGLDTHRGTTTFKVAETDRDVEGDLVKFYKESWKIEAKRARKMAKEEAGHLHRMAMLFGEGTIMEKRGRNIKERKVA